MNTVLNFDFFVVACLFLGAVVIALGIFVVYLNLTSAPVVEAVVKQDGKYLLTSVGTVVVPVLNVPTRELMLSILRSSVYGSPFGCANEDQIVFVPVDTNRQKFIAYYVGTK